MAINAVLCPIDFSESSTHALELAAAVAGWYKARLIALHAYAPLFGSTTNHVVRSATCPVLTLRR